MTRMYVLGSLPNLEFGAKPDTSTKAVVELFEMNLSGNDLHHLSVLRRWIDLSNIYRLIKNEENHDKRGNYVRATLKELLDHEEELPAYVFEFLSEYDSEESKKKHFPKLIADYFSVERKEAGGFLKEFLKFENEWRILITCYRAKKQQLDIADVLKYEDSTDPIVQMSLVQKDSPGAFVFPFEFRHLETAIKEAGPNPTKQMRALAKYRFDYYGEMGYDFPFTLRRVLAYLMQLMQLEEIFALDQSEGQKQLQKLMENKNAT